MTADPRKLVAKLRSLADLYETRPCAPSLVEYGQVDGLLAAADIVEAWIREPDRATPMPGPVVDRAWLNETWLELRASLEGALMLLDRLGRLEHAEDCDHYNACQNAECECPEVEEGCVDHVTSSCTCLVFDAAAKARDVRFIIERTTPPAWRRSSPVSSPAKEMP